MAKREMKYNDDQANTIDPVEYYRSDMLDKLVLALVGNSAVYRGTAEDAAKLPKLADQIFGEVLQAMSARVTK